MRVRFSDAAQRDLENILYAMGAIDPERAKLTSRALRTLTRSIRLAPMLGSPVGPTSAIRKRRMPPYRLLYLVRSNEVLILRIVHERSDWMALV
ncbi:MAG: type II toxin-antitoxin system RelE/ParE family toxin [Pseudomonadota bacterium]